MKTINQTLSPNDMLLGRWYMWANDVQSSLGRLTIRVPRRIEVKVIPTGEFKSEDGQTWECQHVNTSTDAIEHSNEYMEAVTGMPQSIYYESIEACDDCPAYYSNQTEEWHNG